MVMAGFCVVAPIGTTQGGTDRHVSAPLVIGQLTTGKHDPLSRADGAAERRELGKAA